MDKLKFLQMKAAERRIDIVNLISDAKGGHIGGSLSSVDILVALHYEIMRIDAKNPQLEDRDRFILSKGHSVEGYYTVLADLGFISKDELKSFSKFGSRLIGHPNVKVPGVELNTGALGHGLPVAVGMSLAGKMDEKDYKVYVVMGDGELAEGSIWEAAMSAGNYELNNLVAIIDRNRLQISGNTEDVMRLECLKDKWEAFGWDVTEVDGNDISELLKAFNNLKDSVNKPHMIIANTIKGKGVSFMENIAKWHHGVPSEEQREQALKEIQVNLKEVIDHE